MVPVQLFFARSQRWQAARVIVEPGGVRPWSQGRGLVSKTLDKQYAAAPPLPSKQGDGRGSMSQ